MIALQLYTLRSLMGDAAGVDEVLHRVRDIGYRAVEVAGLGPDTVAGFGDALRRWGLMACAAHVPLERLQRDLDGVAEEAVSWGCEHVVVPAVPQSYRSQDGYERFANEASELASRLNTRGLRLAYHNHAYELERYGGRTGLELMFENAPPAALDAELDTYWLQFGGVNPAAWIRRFEGRLPLVHLKDLAIFAGDPADAEIGEGNLDWLEILDACKFAGTRWLIVEQDNPRGDPLDCVALSYRNLERLTEQAGVA